MYNITTAHSGAALAHHSTVGNPKLYCCISTSATVVMLILELIYIYIIAWFGVQFCYMSKVISTYY